MAGKGTLIPGGRCSNAILPVVEFENYRSEVDIISTGAANF